MIAETAARHGRLDAEPRHVEAWMRLEHGTLDALSRQQFDAEVLTCIQCCDAATREQSEHLAQSFGL